MKRQSDKPGWVPTAAPCSPTNHQIAHLVTDSRPDRSGCLSRRRKKQIMAGEMTLEMV